MHRTRRFVGTCLVALLWGGCASGGKTSFTDPAADLGAIRTVAVLPFTALTQNASDAEKVRRIFTVELLALGVVEVVEPGRVAALIASERLDASDRLTPEDFQRVGQALGADGLFLGTVVDFAEGRSGNVPAPEITIELRLVEAASGQTAWTSSQTRSGANARARLFGFGGDSLTAAARKLIREQLESLVK